MAASSAALRFIAERYEEEDRLQKQFNAMGLYPTPRYQDPLGKARAIREELARRASKR